MKRVCQLPLSAPLRRAIAEVALLVVALALLSGTTATNDSNAVLVSIVLIDLLGAGLLALRLHLPRGTGWQRFRAELVPASVFAALMMLVNGVLEVLLVWQNNAALLLSDPSNMLLIAGVFGVLLPIFYGLSYVSLRACVYLACWWNTLRHRRLLWELTHDQLLVLLALMLLGGVAAFVLLAIPVTQGAPFSPLQFSLFGTFYLALAGATLVGALPIALLLAYLLVRRIVRRVEQLAAATDALRQGDYTARVAVTGEDEIARLQTNFNAMAADLDATLHALQIERDRVAGLLNAQRELVASVSHELRTPIATQRAYLNAIRRQALPAALQSDLAVVERESERLHALIDDLFTLSRAEVGRLTLHCAPLDLGAAAEQIVATLAPLAWQRGRVAVRADIPPDLPLAQADAQRFTQVLQNLLQNAVRHTPPGGIVVVALAADAAQLSVAVNDTGSGIAPADLPYIWDRFYRADAARTGDQSGAGLGLALVKELIEAMGGYVAVESTPSVGSSFRMQLPRATPTETLLLRKEPHRAQV